MRSPTCPKCQGSMIEGFTYDNTYGGRSVSAWVAGKPETSMWTGLKLRGRQQLAIATWRCTRCGYLENYATQG